MFKMIANWITSALALFLVSRLISGFQILDFRAALLAVLVIGLVNALIKPVFLLLTLPISILTLGLFTLVANALMLMLAGSITPGFRIDGFGTAFIGSLLFSVLSMILHALVR